MRKANSHYYGVQPNEAPIQLAPRATLTHANWHYQNRAARGPVKILPEKARYSVNTSKTTLPSRPNASKRDQSRGFVIFRRVRHWPGGAAAGRNGRQDKVSVPFDSCTDAGVKCDRTHIFVSEAARLTFYTTRASLVFVIFSYLPSTRSLEPMWKNTTKNLRPQLCGTIVARTRT